MKTVVYTAIFGPYDTLNEPKVVNKKSFDYVCFTDQDFKSDVWEIIKCIPLYEDPTRTARKYKILPHRYLQDWDCSIWLDGNKTIVGDVNKYIEKIQQLPLAIFDHTKCYDKRDCVYDEYRAIIHLGAENGGKFKDNLILMKKQVERYEQEGYPFHNGLAFTCGIVRKHNESSVMQLMEDWWTEVKYGSKRDQLSFNYVCWKNKFKFEWLDGDGRNDGVIIHNDHNKNKIKS